MTNAHGFLLFQFHNGTIKRTPLIFAIRRERYFNSTMVRLKDRRIFFRYSAFSFQFHNGTIKSESLGQKRLEAIIFQFHNGTIKRF